MTSHVVAGPTGAVTAAKRAAARVEDRTVERKQRADLKKTAKQVFRRYKAMAGLHEQMVADYKAKMGALVGAMKRYVEKNIIAASLSKAEKPLLTPQQLDDLRQLIIDYHRGFIAEYIGLEMVPEPLRAELASKGILASNVVSIRAIDEAFYYGKSIVALNKVRPQTLETLTWNDYRKLPKVRLSPAENSAIQWARHAAAVECQGLGNKIADNFATDAIEADADLRRRYRQTIGETVTDNIERRESWRKIVTDLGDKTDDWARDLRRIAATEKTKAMQEGIAAELVKNDPVGDGSETYVAKIPTPDACPSCIKLHLTAGPGSPPKVFKLSELINNGTNRGKKQNAWAAVVGPTHPWCGCEIVEIPEGWGFDEDGELVPQFMRRSDFFAGDLRKSLMVYKDVPEEGLAIRVGDPQWQAVIDKVVADTPPKVFTKEAGVTLITTDTPRPGVALDHSDLAYWTGNEIRLAPHIPLSKLEDVVRHEVAHSLAVHLQRKFGGVDATRAWMKKLYAISEDEGFVSRYAREDEIENHAEATREYLYNRRRLMLGFPRTFAMLHREYKELRL